MIIKIKKLSENFKVPVKANILDACYDVYATSKKDLGDGRIEYGLGFSLQPEQLGSVIQFDFRPRSSIHKTGMILSNCIGTGDEGYTGEYRAVFYKIIKELPDYEIGDRVLQMQVNRSIPIDFILCDDFIETERGDGGYGSSGK